MKISRSFFAAAITAAIAVQATTVIPPTFDQLVNDAEFIFQGTVTNIESQWIGEGNERRIVSFVSFKVDDPIKGAPGATYTIRMLGGTVGEETMQVADAPRFKVGDRDILFVEHNGSQFIPLVGIMHGRFRVQHDEQTGRDVVLTNDGMPLGDLSKLGTDNRAAVSTRIENAMTPAALKGAIQARLGATQ